MSFQPYVPAHESPSELNIKTVVSGILFGILFGCANAYLGLRIGLTISTSIPVAVVTVALFRILAKVFNKPSTILEHNISQTIGSASSSLASGVIFTIPALFLWGLNPSIAQVGTLAACGGLLGVLYMVPLRKFLIVKEHHVLPYPEGTACAEVLKAAEKGGSMANRVFVGLGLGAFFKFVMGYLKLWPNGVHVNVPFIKKCQLGLDPTPALLAVGYILGYRTAWIMVSGGLVAWVLIIPMLATFAGTAPTWLIPDFGLDVASLKPIKIWHNYVRYIGAGAVTAAGIVTLIKAIPTMINAFRGAVQGLTGKSPSDDGSTERTNLDLAGIWLISGISLVILFIAVSPHVIGTTSSILIRLLAAFCIALFAFLFVVVSSRIVGMVGVSSNPTSGMCIVTLLGTGSLMLLLGITGMVGKAAALTIGTVVTVAASIAGDCSQDLKTGYIVGATPRRQQMGELIGVITSAGFVAAAVILLGKTYTFGSAEIPAPQGALMQTVLDAVFSANLPWGLVLFGASLALIAEFLFRIPSLPFAVGVYIPLSTWTPVLVGGYIRKMINKKFGSSDSDTDPGVLLSSGMIAGEGVMGVVIAAIAFITLKKSAAVPFALTGVIGEVVAFAAFALLGYYLYKVAHNRNET